MGQVSIPGAQLSPGTGLPGGAPFSIQYNNGGVFGGIAPGNVGQFLGSNGAGVAPSMQAIVLPQFISGTHVFTGTISHNSTLILGGALILASRLFGTLAAGETHNYNPGGNGLVTRFMLDPDAAAGSVLTGILITSSDAASIYIENIGTAATATITLRHQNAGSNAGNRFICPNGIDFIIPPGGAVQIIYDDSGAAVWRTISSENSVPTGSVGNIPFYGTTNLLANSDGFQWDVLSDSLFITTAMAADSGIYLEKTDNSDGSRLVVQAAAGTGSNATIFLLSVFNNALSGPDVGGGPSGGQVIFETLVNSRPIVFAPGSVAALILDANRNTITKAGVISQGYSRQIPVTGFNITIANNIPGLVLAPAGTLASGTIVMPSTPLDGQEIFVTTSQAITVLTVSGNTGQAVIGPPTTLVAGGFFRMKYVLVDTDWYRTG